MLYKSVGKNQKAIRKTSKEDIFRDSVVCYVSSYFEEYLYLLSCSEPLRQFLNVIVLQKRSFKFGQHIFAPSPKKREDMLNQKMNLGFWGMFTLIV